MDSNVRAGSSPASSTDKKKSQSKALAFFVLTSEPSLLERAYEKQKKQAFQAYFSFFKRFERDSPEAIPAIHQMQGVQLLHVQDV